MNNKQNVKLALLNTLQDDITSTGMGMNLTGDIEFKGNMKFNGAFNGPSSNQLANKVANKNKKTIKFRKNKNKSKKAYSKGRKTYNKRRYRK